MTRYYRRNEASPIRRLALASGLLVLFVAVMLVGKWAVSPDLASSDGGSDLPTPEPTAPASRAVQAVPPAVAAADGGASPGEAEAPVGLARALDEALGSERPGEAVRFPDPPRAPAGTEPVEPPPLATEPVTTAPVESPPAPTSPAPAPTTAPADPAPTAAPPPAPEEPRFEGRIGRQAVGDAPPSPEPSPPSPRPKRKPRPPPRPATKPPEPAPPPASTAPEHLAVWSPAPEPAPDEVPAPVARRARRPRRAPRGQRGLATLQADKLTAAAAAGMVALVHKLLDLGAPVDARDAAGKTALEVAVDAGQGEVVEVLLARGADPALLDGTRRRALVAGPR